MRRPVIVPCAIALSFAMVSCLGALEPEVGPLQESDCSDEDSVPGEDVSFQADLLENLFINSPGACLSCHDPAGENPIGYTSGGMDLTSYQAVLEGGVNSTSSIVVPGAPCESILNQKIGASPPFGSRMPQTGPPFLESSSAQKVADWVAEGANDN